MHFLLMESIPFDQLAKKNDLFAKGVWSALREAAPNIQGAFASALCWFSTRVGLTMELLNVPLWEHKWAHCIAGERHAVYSVADCRQVFKLCQLCQSSTVAFFFLGSLQSRVAWNAWSKSIRYASFLHPHLAVFHGKGQELTQGMCFTKVTVDGLTFRVENHDKCHRLNSCVEAVSPNGECIFGCILLMQCNKCEHFSCKCENSIFFYIQELNVRPDTETKLWKRLTKCFSFLWKERTHVLVRRRWLWEVMKWTLLRNVASSLDRY